MIKRNLYLLYAMQFLQGLVFYGSVSTLYRQQRGLSVFNIMTIEAVSLALALLLEVPWGFVADKLGYKTTLILSGVVYFVSKLVFWQAVDFGSFLLERILLAVAISGLSGCDTALLYVSLGKEGQEARSKKAFGIFNSMGQAGLLLSSVAFSLFIKDNLGLSALLTVFSYGGALLISCFLIPVKTKPREAGASTLPALRALLHDKRFLLFLVGAALLAEASQTITVFLAQLQYLGAGIPVAALGFLCALTTLAGMLSFFTHRLSAVLGEKRLAILLFSMGAAACTALCFGGASAIVSVLGVLALRGAAAIFLPLQQDFQNRQVQQWNRATALSAHAMVLDAAAICTNLIYGRAADFALWLPMALGAVFCALGLIFFLNWRRGAQGSH